MNLRSVNKLRILTPSLDKKLATKDKTSVFEGEIYLGIQDSAENYVEITLEEYNEIIAKEAEENGNNEIQG